MKRLKEMVKCVPGLLWGILLLITVFAIVNPAFISMQNISNVFNNASVLLIVACGMTLAILSGQLDMSVGGVVTFSAMMVGLFMKPLESPSVLQTILALVIGTMAGACFGIFNGVLVGFYQYNYWLVTFATMSIGYGFSQVITNGNIISGYSKAFRNVAAAEIMGIPSLIWIALLVTCFFLFILYKTRFGMHVYAVGDSEQCARQSGINVRRTRFTIFVISGCLAGFAGALLVARTNSASPILGNGYEFDAIAAVIIGGTPFVGGRGGLAGTLIGAVSLYAIKTGLQMVGLSVYVQQVFIGIFILCIIVIDVVNQKRKTRMEGRRIYKS